MKTILNQKYKLYLNKSQAIILEKYQNHCRLIWNLALAQRLDYWDRAKTHGVESYKSQYRPISEFGQSKELTQLKKEFDFLYETPAGTLCNVLTALDLSFKLFFSNLKKNKDLAGKPRFKRKGDSIALKFKDARSYPITKLSGDNYSRVTLPKIGSVRFREHKDVKGIVKNCMVKKETDGWYITMTVETDVVFNSNAIGKVGIDMGVAHTMTLSTGETLDMPEYIKETEVRIKYLKSKIDRRKKKGSKNWKKAVAKISKLQQKAARSREYFVKLAVHKLTSENKVIVIEDLKVRNMTKSTKGTVEDPGKNVKAKNGLNRVILYNNFGAIRKLLKEKCEQRGVTLIEVNPRFTSQTCSYCGNKSKENRQSQAEFKCVSCGHAENADVNAAKNILKIGLEKMCTEDSDNKILIQEAG